MHRNVVIREKGFKWRSKSVIMSGDFGCVAYYFIEYCVCACVCVGKERKNAVQALRSTRRYSEHIQQQQN